MYLLVVTALIIDSYPLKSFWVTLREYLVLGSSRILFPNPIIYTTPLLASTWFWLHRQVFNFILTRSVWIDTPFGFWNSPAVDHKLLPSGSVNSLVTLTLPFWEAPLRQQWQPILGRCCEWDSGRSSSVLLKWSSVRRWQASGRLAPTRCGRVARGPDSVLFQLSL